MNTPTFNPRLAIRTTASFLVAVALTATTSGASSQPTCVLPVSAYVTDSAGTPLDGATDLELRFYVESDPDAVAVECRSLADVAVDNGWLRLLVDACADPSPGDCGASPLTDLVTGADALWVGLRIGDAEGELSPRLPIGAAPYAIRAADSDTLDGLDAVEFERAGAAEAAVGTHAAGPDAHHSSTSDGIAITPASATVDDVLIDGDIVDFGPDADDELNAEIVRTLTGGGNADALHEHTGHGDGGGCYTGWGATSCLEGWAIAYDGIVLAPDGNGTRELAGLYCFEDENLSESSSVGYYYRLLGPATGDGVFGDYQSTLGEMPCIVCCQ